MNKLYNIGSEVMVKGKLEFDDNAEYVVKNNESETNLNCELNSFLLDRVEIHIAKNEKTEIKRGRLARENDLGGTIYRYWLKRMNLKDDYDLCLDELLFEISDDKDNEIEFKLKVLE